MKTHRTILDTSCTITRLVHTTESVSLDLLRDIDSTVENLGSLTKVVSGLAEMTRSITREVDAMAVEQGEYIDPDDNSIDGMQRSIDHYKDRLAAMVFKRKSIDADRRLSNHHCEALHDAYEAAEWAVSEIIDALAHAKAAIIRHDLAAEPRGESFSTVEELIESLSE